MNESNGVTFFTIIQGNLPLEQIKNLQMLQAISRNDEKEETSEIKLFPLFFLVSVAMSLINCLRSTLKL